MKPTLFLVSVLLIISCQSPPSSPYDHITNTEVKTLLQKGIEASGGLDAWKDLGTYTFTKDAILYLEDGSIESETLNQKVKFNNFPNLSGSVNWMADSSENIIVYNENAAQKLIDGKTQDAEQNEAARLSFLGAHIVMSFPFKLLDPGVKLTYGGKGQQYGKEVEILMADYNAEETNHTKTHRWWHYFEAGNYKYLGYKVYHPPTYALVENQKTTELRGIAFPLERTTWRVDANDNKEYIRGKFSYSDFR